MVPRIKTSKYWVEQNNLPELQPIHIGYIIWTLLDKPERRQMYNNLRESLKKYGEIVILHYIGSKVRYRDKNRYRSVFIGESKIDDKCKLYKVSATQVETVVENILRRSRVDEKDINKYLNQAKKVVEKDTKRYGRNIKYIVYELKDYREYRRPVSLKEVQREIDYKPIQGKYLVPITLKDYRVISERGLKQGIVIPRKTTIPKIDPREFKKFVNERNGFYPEEVLNEVVIGFENNKHILLTGPPGVGKTFLAELLAEFLGYDLVKTTASATWTRYDFIGGPRIVGGSLKWRSGIFLRALYKHLVMEKEDRGALLLIDELNRCEADKVLAEFFTIYSSSDPEKWVLSDSILEEIKTYDERDEPANHILKELGEKNYRVPRGFRIIATINEWDIAHLHVLGYALLRRFHVVRVKPVKREDPDKLYSMVSSLLQKYINVDSERLKQIINHILDLAEKFRENSFPLGTAHVIEAIKISYSYFNSFTDNIDEAVDHGFSSVLNSVLQLRIARFTLPREIRSNIKKIVKEGLIDKNRYKKTWELIEELVKGIEEYE